MKRTLLLGLLLNITLAYSQTNPVITSWIQNNTNATNPTYPSLECNVQSVYYTSTYSYVSASSVPGYIIGPWVANPNVPSDQNFISKFPLNPTVNAGVKTNTGLGSIGLWTNGVSIYNAKDGQYWNNATSSMTNGITQTGWNRNAYYWEGISFDACKGHPGPGGGYHHHVAPVCLYNQNATTVHSPIIGYAWDGFPIYGAYAYTNTNGTGAIKRMVSSYVLSSASSRTLGPPVNATYPLGSMCEDYVYTAGAGDLDQYNGRTCITPEYPAGTYAYFVTIDASGTPAYPFVLSSKYYGTIVGAAFTNQTIPAGATQYLAATLPVEIYDFSAHLSEDNIMLTWNVAVEQNIHHYEIERSENALDFSAISTLNADNSKLYHYEDTHLADGKYYYRIKTVDNAGQFEYSATVSIFMENEQHIIIHNNPAKDILTIQENSAMNERRIYIVDVAGNIVKQTSMNVGITMLSLDVQTLYDGMYIVKIIDGNVVKTSKLIIYRN